MDDLIDISEEEKGKILTIMAKRVKAPKDITTASHSLYPSKLYISLLKIVNGIEKNPVLSRAFQSQNFADYKHLSIPADSSLQEEISEYFEKVGRLGSLRSVLVLLKSCLAFS